MLTPIERLRKLKEEKMQEALPVTAPVLPRESLSVKYPNRNDDGTFVIFYHTEVKHFPDGTAQVLRSYVTFESGVKREKQKPTKKIIKIGGKKDNKQVEL